MAVPTSSEIVDLGLARSLKAICEWAGMSEALSSRWCRLMGYPVEGFDVVHLRVLAALAKELYEQTINGWTDTRQDVPLISLCDKRLALAVYNAAILVSKAPEPAVETATKTVKPEVRKVKLSSLVDATDESEVESASPDRSPRGMRIAKGSSTWTRCRTRSPLRTKSRRSTCASRRWGWSRPRTSLS